MAQRVFASQQVFDEAFAGVTDIFIDVTEIPIERAVNQDKQCDHFSEKKTFIRSNASSLEAN